MIAKARTTPPPMPCPKADQLVPSHFATRLAVTPPAEVKLPPAYKSEPEIANAHTKKFIPSPTGLGLAFTINGFNVISMFIGSVIALTLAKTKPQVAQKYTIPVSSGIIAGESLMGVAIAILSVFKVLS